MKIHYIYTLLLCVIISACAISCDDANDWPVDHEKEAPFRPIKFSWTTLRATSVELGYTGVLDANKYVFEFSEGDSLEFNNIVRTVDILADTLTVYSDNKSPTKKEYRTIFDDLKGTTRYSVRMKGVNNSNQETGYVETFFDTPAEQVLIRTITSANRFTLQWDPEKEVTDIKWAEIVADQDTIYEERALTPEELANGIATIYNLKAGTDYYLLVMKEDQQRGYAAFKTLGSSGGPVITVSPTDVVNDILRDQLASGVKTLALMFPANPAVYELDPITVPDGIENLFLVGDRSIDGFSNLRLSTLSVEGSIDNLVFQNVNIDGNGADFFMTLNKNIAIKNITFDGCGIENLNRSLIYFSHDDLKIETVKINNCMFRNVSSGYGLLNMSKKSTIGSVSITKSTLIEIGDQLMDMRDGLGTVSIDQCTFYNHTRKLPKIFRFRAIPESISVTNTIFSGTNGGAKLETWSDKDVSHLLSFYGCYLTADIIEGDDEKKMFTDAIRLTTTSEELFTDPQNDIFFINEGVRFPGEGVAGDPRWNSNK